MLNVNNVLDKLNIRKNSINAAVTDVGVLVQDSSDPIRAACKLFDDVLNVSIQFSDIFEARVTSKYMIEQVLLNKCEIDDSLVIVNIAKQKAQKYLSDPKNSHIYARSEEELESAPEKVAVATDIDVKVEVHSSGKIKRGGKQVLAYELYKLHVLDATTPLNNKQFVAILIKELSMTKAGATTYVANLKKTYGAPEGFSMKKGRNKG